MPHPTPTQRPGTPQKYYTTGEASRMLGISPFPIFRAVTRKDLKVSRTPGGHYRFTREDLEEFMRKKNRPIPTAWLRPRRILILGTNPARLRRLVVSLWTRSDTWFKTANPDFSSGILTRSFKPDIILLDASLKSSVKEITTALHSDPKLKYTKILTLPSGQNVRIQKIMETM